MKAEPTFAPLCQSFFAKRLIAQRCASPHTVAAYAQTFRLLVRYAQERLGTPPSKLALVQLDAPFLASFLDQLEGQRANAARSRNARLAALRSFYHYASRKCRSTPRSSSASSRSRINGCHGRSSVISRARRSMPSSPASIKAPVSGAETTRSCSSQCRPASGSLKLPRCAGGT